MNFVWQALLDNNLNRLLTITIVHVCSSHLIRGIKRAFRKLTKDERIIIYACYIVTGIIHATDLKTAASIWKHAVLLFGTPLDDKKLYESVRFIRQFSKETEEIEKDLPTLSDIDDKMKKEESRWKLQREQSPFCNYFLTVSKSVKPVKVSKEARSNTIKNPFYCPDFPNYFLEEVLTYFPLVSGIVIQIYGIKRQSNIAVENWFNFVKNTEFEKKLKS